MNIILKTDSTAKEFEKANMSLDINPEDANLFDYDYSKNDSLNEINNYKIIFGMKLPQW